MLEHKLHFLPDSGSLLTIILINNMTSAVNMLNSTLSVAMAMPEDNVLTAIAKVEKESFLSCHDIFLLSEEFSTFPLKAVVYIGYVEEENH